jgi:hypothetical protein
VVTGSADQTAKVWDATSGQELLTLKGHTDGISSVAFSPDNRRVVTGSADKTAKVWDATGGQELLTLKGHTNGISSVAVSSDNRRMVTGSADKTAVVWWAASIEQVSAWDREETAAEQRLALARKDLVAARERERVLRSEDPGAIRRWLVLAPLPYGIEAKNGAAALDHEQVSQEAQLRPLAGQKVTTVGGERVWTKVEQGDGLVDFNRLVGDLSEWSVAYAFCYVRVATDQSHLVIWVGSDDQSKIYLDGREIYSVHQARPYVQDLDAIRGVHLKAGTHALLFKVVNQPLDWQGSVRFTDAAGQPVPGLEITLTP